MTIVSMSKKISPMLLAMFVALCSMLTYFLFVGPPVWGTNDDIGMSMIAAGVWLSNQPSAELLYIHPFYGWLISTLDVTLPDVPWYGIFFVIIVGLSLSVLNYSILRLRREFYFSLLVMCATIVTALPALWHLQFTIVAGLSSLAGLMLFLSFFISEPETKKIFVAGCFSSYCLLMIGAMIRFDSMLMICVLFTPYIAVLFFKYFIWKSTKLLERGDDTFIRCCDSRSCELLETKKDKLKKIYFIKLAIIGIIVATSIIGLQVYEHRHYRNSPEWVKWFSLNKAKAEFIDFKRINYNAYTKNIFNSVGWSKTDFNMITSWQYVDPVKFAPEKFIFVVNSLQKEIRKKILQQVAFEKFKFVFIKIIDGVQSLSSAASSLLFCILIAGLLAIRWQKWNFFYICAVICGVFVVLIYIYLVLNRAPFRVLVLLWISVLWMVLLISTNTNNREVTTKNEKNLRQRTYFKELFQINDTKNQVGRWAGYKIIVPIMLVFMLIVSVCKDFGTAREKVKSQVEDQIHMKQMIDTWASNLPSDSVIYCVGDNFQYEFQLPLNSFTYMRKIKGFIGTGSGNQSPHQRKVISDLGLGDDFYASLAKKEHVYTVMQRKKTQMDILRAYYKEVYGLEFKLIEQPNLPYLYRMLFNKKHD